MTYSLSTPKQRTQPCTMGREDERLIYILYECIYIKLKTKYATGVGSTKVDFSKTETLYRLVSFAVTKEVQIARLFDMKFQAF